MTILRKNYKMHGLLIGILLGFGAPIGSLLFRSFFEKSFDSHWLVGELAKHLFFYGYMTFATPIIFAVFGYSMGFLLDKLFSKEQSLEALNIILEKQSITDDMTGLYNHRHLIDFIGKEIERSKRYHHVLSTMMIDIDDFKKVNDQYGHLVGDRVLREFASLLKNAFAKLTR